MRVFWPTKGLKKKTTSGTAVGWREGDNIVVVAVVDKFEPQADAAAAVIGDTNGKVKDVKDDDKTKTKAVGTVNSKATDDELSRPLQAVGRVLPAQSESNSETPAADKGTAVATDDSSLTVWIAAGRPVAYSVDAETVLYTPPKPLTHLTTGDVTPRAAAAANGAAAQAAKDSDLAPILALLNDSAAAQASLAGPKGKLKGYLGYGRHAFTIWRQYGSAMSNLRLGFGLIPSALVAADVVYETRKRTLPTIPLPEFTVFGQDFGGELGGHTWGKDSVLERPTPVMVLRNAFTLYTFWSTVSLYALTLIPYSPHLLAVFIGILTAVVAVLSAEVNVFGRTFSLRRSSAFLKQVAVRAGQVKTLETSLRSEIEGAPTTNEFLKVRKAVFTDMLTGFFFSAIVSALLAIKPLPIVDASVFATPLIAAVEWLNAWPIGLKLNTPLSNYFSTAFSSVLTWWCDVVAPVLPQAQVPAEAAVLLVALGGLSFAFALVSDIVSLLTLHLRICYAVTAQLCTWQLAALKGLYDLFRGKRWNVLRERTDSHAYDVDTLFLGTLLFTLMTFLAPTVLAYGTLFALINAAVLGVQFVLGLAVGALDTVPTHDAMSFAFKPGAIPAGIVFDVVPPPTTKVADTSAKPPRFTLLLKGTPKSIPSILGAWFKSALAEARSP